MRVLKAAIDAAIKLGLVSLLAAFLALPYFGISLNQIVSESMAPALNMGDIIFLKRVDTQKDIHIGDIIGFRMEAMNTPVCHRVVDIVQLGGEIGFKTKGDATEEADLWVVPPEDVLGVVVYSIPRIGYVVNLTRTPYGFFLFLGLPALVFGAIEISAAFRSGRNRSSWNPDQISPVFFLFIGLVVIGALGSMMAGNLRVRTIRPIAGMDGNQAGEYKFESKLQNNSPFPLVICLSSDKAYLIFDQGCFLLKSGENKTIEVKGMKPSEEAQIHMGGFFPLLPKQVIYSIFRWNPRLAPLVVAFIPVFPWIAIGALLLRGSYSARARRREKILARRRRFDYY